MGPCGTASKASSYPNFGRRTVHKASAYGLISTKAQALLSTVYAVYKKYRGLFTSPSFFIQKNKPGSFGKY